jgi:hypothetical protein
MKFDQSSVCPHLFRGPKVSPSPVRFWDVRTALAIVALMLLAALSMGKHWGGDITWETDALFYQAKTEQILGADGEVARKRIFGGPLSNYVRGLEAQSPDEPRRVSNPAWVEFNVPFYERRLLLPALAAVLKPVLGLHALETLSLLGFVLVPALLFLLLRRRLSFTASFAVSAAIILWPPLRAWSVFPLTDSAGLALLIAGLICALFVTERGPRWLVPWVLCVGALSITRDTAFLLVIAALVLLVVQRDRRSAALAGSGFVAALPAPLVHSVPLSKLLAFVFARHSVPTDTSWGAVIPQYPGNLVHQAGRYVDYAAANPHVVLIAVCGIVAAFALAPRRDPFTILLWATLPAYMLFLAIGPAFSAFRYELVLVPLIAFGYGHVAERVIARVAAARASRVPTGDPVST